MKIETEGEHAYAEENYEAPIAGGKGPALVKSLGRAMSPLSPYRIKRFIKKFFRFDFYPHKH